MVDDGFNSDFFKRIDDIENDIANGLSLKEISNNYSLSISESKNFFKTNEDNTDLNEVYDSNLTNIFYNFTLKYP